MYSSVNYISLLEPSQARLEVRDGAVLLITPHSWGWARMDEGVEEPWPDDPAGNSNCCTAFSNVCHPNDTDKRKSIYGSEAKVSQPRPR